MEKPFITRLRLRSFTHAISGLGIMLVSQHNAWLHAVATAGVVIFGICSGLDKFEWCIIVLAIVSVWIAEAMNTALEFLADAASPGYHPLVKKAKDVAAGAVLLSSIGAAFAGVVILGPYLMKMIDSLK